MGLFDFLKKKKEETAEVERAMPLTLDGFDPESVVPPETRYTQEYQDFLASQEAGQGREIPQDETEKTDDSAEEPERDAPREFCDATVESEEEESVTGDTAEECDTDDSPLENGPIARDGQN